MGKAVFHFGRSVCGYQANEADGGGCAAGARWVGEPVGVRHGTGEVLPAGCGWCLCSASFTPLNRACPATQYLWDHLVVPTQSLC